MTLPNTADDTSLLAGSAGTAQPPARTAPRGPSAVLTLARTESVRLLRHPAFLAATALYAALWGYDLVGGDAAHRFPVLQDQSWSIHLTMLLMAAGVLLAANQGALRAHRDLTEATYEVLVVSRARRVSAHLLSLLPVTALALLLSWARIGYLASRSGAVGTVRPWEVLVGPLCVLVGGVIGVLLSTLLTSAAAAPLAVVGLGVLTLAGAINAGASWSWLGLLAFEDENAAPLPNALVDRPAVAHLFWLVALAVVFALCAVLRAGDGRIVLRTAAVLALAGAVVAGVVQTGGPSAASTARITAYTDHPARYEHCVTKGSLTTCAFPGFEAWTGEWTKAADGVLQYAPSTVATAPYTIRQRIFPQGSASSSGTPLPLADWARDDAAAGTPKAVTVGTDWSDGAAAGDVSSDAVAAFATGFAYRAVTGQVPDRPRLTMVCGARATLVLWLAAEATPGTGAALRSARARTFGGGVSFPLLDSSTGLSFEPRAADFAFELINGQGKAAAAVKANWAELTAPTTTVDQAAQLLGVKTPPAIPASEQVAGC